MFNQINQGNQGLPWQILIFQDYHVQNWVRQTPLTPFNNVVTFISQLFATNPPGQTGKIINNIVTGGAGGWVLNNRTNTCIVCTRVCLSMCVICKFYAILIVKLTKFLIILISVMFTTIYYKYFLMYFLKIIYEFRNYEKYWFVSKVLNMIVLKNGKKSRNGDINLTKFSLVF